MLAAQALPHSLGLLYEELTAHLGFRRSSDEYKVMAMASYGEPAFLDAFRELVRADGARRLRASATSTSPRFAPPLAPGGEFTPAPRRPRRDACSGGSRRCCSSSPRWLHARTGDRDLVMAGGVALNCVANSRLWREGPFERVWVQPAAGDAGTALGAALHVAHELGDAPAPMRDAPRSGAAGTTTRSRRGCETAGVAFERPDDVADAVAEALADNEVVAWFQGRSEFGPRALGHRSLLADPRQPANLEKLNDIKGREQFRPVAPMVLAERAAEIFDGGPIPSPFMLFTHRVRDGWAERIPAVVHVDGTARIQTVDRAEEPLVARMLERFEARTGVPGRRQHEPQHRRAADGRRPARRARVLRLGAGRPARDRAVRRAARRASRACRSARGARSPRDLRRRHPDAAGRLRACSRALAAGPGRARAGPRRRRPARRARSRCSPPVPLARRACVRGPARGPAAARNAGWRACAAEWVAFLDDDVVPGAGLGARRSPPTSPRAGAGRRRRAGPDRRPAAGGPAADRLGAQHAPGSRRARWATADLAYRRAALAAVGGFDERFPRAYREDADLGLRVTAAGWRIVRGERHGAPSGRARRRRGSRSPSRPATPTTC